jgi:glycosyltransferase involved in cell wall biosynthesis
VTRPRVALISNALGLGGTEKMLESYATRQDRSRFDVHVIGVYELGERAPGLQAAGIEVSCAEGDGDRLAELLRGTDVAHVFRWGMAEPIVPAACRAAGVARMVETNIFGSVDPTPDEAAFDVHLFVSTMCLLRYRKRVGGDASAAFHRRHRVLSAPIEHEALAAHAPASKRAARELLGLDPERPVVGRVGRASDTKWRTLVVDMIPPLLEIVPDAQVLLVGATPAKVERLRALGILDRCVLHDPTLDPERLAAFYVACDVFASASEIGESQGIAINEAQSFGVPVVTCSTPWADNAQVEFVEHGRSGWLASSPQSFAEAVADLLRDPARRAAFGEAGRADIARMLSVEDIPARLGALYAELLGGPPAPWSPDAGDIEAFARDYPRRAKAEFRPLTARERTERRTTRLREHWGHLAVQARTMLRR